MDVLSVLLKIKLKRIAVSLSQEDMADKLGIDRSQYSRIESGKTDLGLSKLIKILELLDMDFAEFDEYRGDNSNIKDIRNDLRTLKNTFLKNNGNGKK